MKYSVKRRGSMRMPPPTVPAMTAPSRMNREMPIPCLPNGGIANFDRKVAPISGVARRAKGSQFVVETAPPEVFPIATVGATTALPIDHCTEQRDFRRFELRLDAYYIRQAGVMAVDGENRAPRARCDELRVGALANRCRIDDHNIVFDGRGLHQVAERNTPEQLLWVGGRISGAQQR